LKKSKGKKKYIKTNENGNTTIQNLWDAPKATLTGKFLVIQVYQKKQKYQRNNLILHIKEQEKEEQRSPKLVEGRK